MTDGQEAAPSGGSPSSFADLVDASDNTICSLSSHKDTLRLVRALQKLNPVGAEREYRVTAYDQDGTPRRFFLSEVIR